MVKEQSGESTLRELEYCGRRHRAQHVGHQDGMDGAASVSRGRVRRQDRQTDLLAILPAHLLRFLIKLLQA